MPGGQANSFNLIQAGTERRAENGKEQAKRKHSTFNNEYPTSRVGELLTLGS